MFKNLDLLQAKKTECLQALANAIRNGDEEQLDKAYDELSQFLCSEVVAHADAATADLDSHILMARNVRQLTSNEQKYYKAFIEAHKSSNPVQAIANIDIAMPTTIIDDVIANLKKEHPLLSKINFVNTTAITTWIINKQGQQQAAWGPLNSEITKELQGAIDEINVTLCKLTAFMYVSNDLLDLGPAWVDTYVRNVLMEAVAVSSEVAIVDGTGKDQPIGMTRDISDDVSVSGGVYPQKEAVAITDLSPETYGTILAGLADDGLGGTRTVTNVIMIVNPKDYFKLVMPATTVQLPTGGYANNVLPYPTTIIQSVGAPEGKGVIGLGYNYFFGLGGAKGGKIERDDSYKFLEDKATYKIKFYGNGRAVDDTSFALLDISGLQSLVYTVKTVAGEDETVAGE